MRKLNSFLFCPREIKEEDSAYRTIPIIFYMFASSESDSGVLSLCVIAASPASTS